MSTQQFSTRAIHAGFKSDPATGAILTPIYQTATYVQEGIDAHKGYTYSRTANPTVTALEKKLANLEGADAALCFATGMAATTTLFLSLLKKGDHIICSDVVYGGTVRLLRQILEKFGIESSFVDTAIPEEVEKALLPHTALVFIETPANPTLKLTDIAAIAKITHHHQLPLVVDNTFLTAALQRPLELGADIVLYSTTKYIDGHNATVGGALLTNRSDWIEAFHFTRNTTGSIQSPFDAFLILQGLKTLSIRMTAHSNNALAVARFLASHPHIEKVTYPGLESGSAFGGILTFEIKGGYASCVEFIKHLNLCVLAESLGSVETLLTHPASMTHGAVPIEERHRIGISDGLIRLSVGLEAPEDIIQDINTALSKL